MTEAVRDTGAEWDAKVMAMAADGLQHPLDPATQALVDEHIAEYRRQESLQLAEAAGH